MNLRVLASVVVYPVLVGGAAVGAAAAATAGAPSWAVAAATLVLVTPVVVLLERWMPWVPAGRVGGVGTDLLHAVLSARWVDLGGLLAAAALPAVPGLWPVGAPLAAQVALGLAVLELGLYLTHRAGHSFGWWWRLHAIHHSAPFLDWWIVWRNHPLDNLLTALATGGLLALAGAPDRVLAVCYAITAAHGTLQHANVEQRTGPLDLVLATARVHRLHHSVHPERANANYGTTLTVWDWVFGTRRLAEEPDADLGPGPLRAPFPTGWWDQVRAPFQGWRW